MQFEWDSRKQNVSIPFRDSNPKKAVVFVLNFYTQEAPFPVATTPLGGTPEKQSKEEAQNDET
jgi:hypothetical protein